MRIPCSARAIETSVKFFWYEFLELDVIKLIQQLLISHVFYKKRKKQLSVSRGNSIYIDHFLRSLKMRSLMVHHQVEKVFHLVFSELFDII